MTNGLIRTERLDLVPAMRAHFAAMRESDAALGDLLGAEVADEWVGLEDHREAIATADRFLPEAPADTHWWTYFFVLRDGPLLIGCGGLMGEPVEGVAELGYALAPGWRGRGLATEAARGLMDFAFADERVRSVRAHTLAAPNASTRVLERLGMSFEREIADPEDGDIWRWSIGRGGGATKPHLDAQL